MSAMESVNIFKSKPSGCCLKCSTKACLVCHRCGDFYCSRECQLRDWQRHRYICFPIPPLVEPIESSIANINATDLENAEVNNARPVTINVNGIVSSDRTVETTIPIPIEVNSSPVSTECHMIRQLEAKTITPINETQNNIVSKDTTPPIANIPSGSTVYITSFTSANRCYIRDASETAEKAHFAVCQEVNSAYKELPRKNKIRYAEYGVNKFNGTYHRVKSIDKANSSRLLLVDEGITKILNLVQMREINTKLMQLPCCSMLVQIENAPHMGYDVGVFKKFEGIKFIVTFKPNGHVELRQKDAPKSLNTQIIEFYGRPNNSDTQNNLNTKVLKAVTNNGNFAQLQLESCQDIVELNQKPAAIVNEVSTKRYQTKEKEANSTNNQAVIDRIEPQLKQNESHSGPPADETTKPNVNEANSNISTESSHKLVKDNQTLMQVPASSSSLLPTEKLILSSLNCENSANMTPLLCPPFLGQRLCSKSQDGLDVCIVENANVSRGILAAFDKSNMADIYEIRSRLLEFKDPRHYRPVLKEYVIALSEVHGWCRAKIMEIKGNQYCVLYLDFACGATVPENSIRRYPADFVMPCFTSICLIDGFPHKLNKRQIDFLDQNLKLNSFLHIDTVSYLQDMALIKCQKLIDQLNEL